MEHGEQFQMFKKYNKEGGYGYIQYWMDENGQDWYDYADHAETHTLKVLTNERNIVVGFDYDATTLSPNECNLHIIQPEDVPDDLESIKYSYDGEKFYLTEVVKRETAEDIKNKLFLLMLKSKLTAAEKVEFEELKSRLEEKLKNN